VDAGTGEMLRCNFAMLADLVLDQDEHLLDEAEKDMIERFKVQWTLNYASLTLCGNKYPMLA
jgi:hypothetical protein